MKGENMHIQQRQPLLKNQDTFQGTAQMIGRHNDREGSQGIARFYGTEIVNELGLERGMKWAGYKTEHQDRGSLIVKGQRDPPFTFGASRVTGDERRAC